MKNLKLHIKRHKNIYLFKRNDKKYYIFASKVNER